MDMFEMMKESPRIKVVSESMHSSVTRTCVSSSMILLVSLARAMQLPSSAVFEYLRRFGHIIEFLLTQLSHACNPLLDTQA